MNGLLHPCTKKSMPCITYLTQEMVYYLKLVGLYVWNYIGCDLLELPMQTKIVSKVVISHQNLKFKMNNWIAIHTMFASSSYSKISMRLDEVDCFSGRNSGRKSSQLRLLFLWQRLPGIDLTCILLFQLSESARLLYVSLTVYLPFHSLIYIPLTYSADAAHAEQREQNDDYEVVSCAP